MKLLALILVIVGLCWSGTIVFVAAQSATLSHQVSVVCKEHKVLAKIAKEEVVELIANNKTITPKLTLPGLTHAELVKLTNEKIERKQKHVNELEEVRKATC